MEVKNSSTSRRLKYGSNYIMLSLIVLGILAVLNFFFLRHFYRIDLTQDKRFTLTSSTKEVLGNLDDTVDFLIGLFLDGIAVRERAGDTTRS